ncbi:hypothetical protein [Microbacterium sp.]|uniref:hypothetical protein n=1 Tax=Microbacterium sp. TaxID=51671 RepID=UPI0035647266
MDGTQDAARDGATEQVRTDSAVEPMPPFMSRTAVRRLSWAIAWVMPVIALAVGIALTASGTSEVWTPVGDDTYDVTLLAVWPVGLVLLAVGALGLIAAAIATAVMTSDRAE